MPELPAGTVTFLFTDIEGSTRLLQEHGSRYADLLAEHRRALRDAFTRHSGVEVDTQGDAFFVAFPSAADAVAAAAEARHELEAGPIRVRMGIHTGEPIVTDEGYVGVDVHRAARIAAAAHGGQIVLSETTRRLLDSDTATRDLGEHRLKDLTGPERLHQLGDGDFPPLRTLDATNLPVASSPLVGREHELDELVALLSERHAAPHDHRSGWHRKDSSRAPGRSRTDRHAARRRLLGPAREPLRPAARVVGGSAGDRGARRPRRFPAGQGAPDPARQLRASPRRGSCRERRPRRIERTPRAGHQPGSPARVGRAGVSVGTAHDERRSCTLRRAGACGRSRARARRDRRGDLPPPRRSPARGRARRGPHEAPRSGATARAPRLGASAPDRRGTRRPRTPTHAARHDRVELRPPRCCEQGALRKALGLRRQLPDRGRRGDLRRGPRRPRSARRLKPLEADRRRPIPDAGDDPRVCAREARSLGSGRGASPASCTFLLRTRRGGVRATLRRRVGVVCAARSRPRRPSWRARLAGRERPGSRARARRCTRLVLAVARASRGREWAVGRRAHRVDCNGSSSSARTHSVGVTRGEARRSRRGASAGRSVDPALARAR